MTESSADQPPPSAITDALADLQATTRGQEDVYKQLHSHPELSFQETKTVALAASRLREFGYEVFDGIGQTGVGGVLRNGEGQTVLTRGRSGRADLFRPSPVGDPAPLATAGRAGRLRREMKMMNQIGVR